MHELAITENILDIAARQAEQHGARRLTAITLVVGDLTGYLPDSMQFYFEVLSKGTLAEHATLLIKRQPTRLRCRACRFEFEPLTGMLWICPACEAIGGDVISGKELLVESIEIE
jgi:hydrogenase nickel incorporation protein HypA/HybF